jgi:hypothetical protein
VPGNEALAGASDARGVHATSASESNAIARNPVLRMTFTGVVA